MISIGKLDVLKVIIDKVRQHAAIIVRTRHIEALYKIGATQVIPEEFETAIDLFERVMANFLLPRKEIDSAIDKIFEVIITNSFLEETDATKFNISKDIPDVEIIPMEVIKGAQIIEKYSRGSRLREQYGITWLPGSASRR